MMMTSSYCSRTSKATGCTASFCDQRQLAVNLSKRKVVVSEPGRSDVADFVLNGAVVERGES